MSNCTRLPNQMNVTEFMLRWINQQGFPVIIAYNNSNNLALYQDVFQLSRNELKKSPYE